MAHTMRGKLPPEGGGRRNHNHDWYAVADSLRETPGEWQRVFEKDRYTLVIAIQQNGISPLQRKKGFEVKTRNNIRENRSTDPPTKRTCDLWMRYVPERDTTKEKDAETNSER